MSEITETINYREHEIQVCYDMNPESPRKWDNLGILAFFHKKYNCGDKVDFKSKDFNGWDEMEHHIRTKLNGVVILPVCMYDHSGQTIYIGTQHDRWDGGRVGFIYATRNDVLKEYGAKKITAEMKEKAKKLLEGEIDVMDDYIRGDVYGYKVLDAHGEELDACWGYYGDDGKKQAIVEAQNIIDHTISKKINYHLQVLKSWILNKVSINHRKPLSI